MYRVSFYFPCDISYVCLFFFNDTATTEIYTLSLHDALPICRPGPQGRSHSQFLWNRQDRSADRKSTRLNSSHVEISYAVFCLKKKKMIIPVVAIPISLIGAVFLMLAAGFTINLLTLLAIVLSVVFFFNDTATTEIYTLSLHDALPI